MILHTLMVLHILICGRKVDRALLFLRNNRWLALDRSTLSLLCGDFCAMITFTSTVLQAFPLCATSIILIRRQSFTPFYYFSKLILLSFPFTSMSSSIVTSHVNINRYVLILFDVLFSPPAFERRSSCLDLSEKSFLE